MVRRPPCDRRSSSVRYMPPAPDQFCTTFDPANTPPDAPPSRPVLKIGGRTVLRRRPPGGQTRENPNTTKGISRREPEHLRYRRRGHTAQVQATSKPSSHWSGSPSGL